MLMPCVQVRAGRMETFYLMIHSTHFIYGYMVPDIWHGTIQMVREETYYLCS